MLYGELLVHEGAIDRSQLHAALTLQDQKKKPLGELLLELGYLDETSFLRSMAMVHNTRYVASEKLARLTVSTDVVNSIPQRLAEEHVLFPISLSEDNSALAMVSCEPQNQQGILEARLVSGVEQVFVFMARRETIELLIDRHYGTTSAAEPDACEELLSIEIDLSCSQPQPAEPASGVPTAEPDNTTTLTETTRIFIQLLEQQTPGRAGHSGRVARLVQSISELLGLDAEETAHNVLAAYLHDLGRSSETHLTPISIEASTEHALSAHEHRETPVGLMASTGLPEPVCAILRQQYETPPAAAAPLGARIIGCVDAFDDLIHNPDNPFQKQHPPQQALHLLQGTYAHLFDAQVLGLLEQALAEEDLRARRESGRPVVLIAEPDRATAALLQTCLCKAGYDALVAHSSFDVTDILGRHDIAAVIVEMSVGPQDGFDVLERARRRARKIPVIMVGQDPQPYDVTRAFKEGVDDFISKPLGLDVVLKSLGRLVPPDLRAVTPDDSIPRTVPTNNPPLPQPGPGWFSSACVENDRLTA